MRAFPGKGRKKIWIGFGQHSLIIITKLLKNWMSKRKHLSGSVTTVRRLD